MLICCVLIHRQTSAGIHSLTLVVIQIIEDLKVLVANYLIDHPAVINYIIVDLFLTKFHYKIQNDASGPRNNSAIYI